MDIWLRALILALVFAAVLIIVERIVGGVIRSRAAGGAINKRLDMIAKGATHEETMLILRRGDYDPRSNMPSILGGWASWIHQLLVQAGITTGAGRIVVLLMVLPLAIFLAFVLLFSLAGYVISPGRILLLGTVAAVLGVAFPMTILRVMATRRRRRMGEQFPVALDVFVRGLRAGHPVAAALELLTTEMPDPIGSEFGLVVDEVTYGADLRDALDEMADRWDIEDIRMFVVSLSVQSETGGNLAEILENLTKVIRERQAMVMKVRALSSEGRMTALMLSVLPLVALVITFLGNSSFFLDVADDPMFIPSFGVLILMWVIGVMMIRKMIDLKV
ncbi:type II secretion system F family protein [Sphingomicrobium nitratireducens]|uniref:type II secretion system F family protein n=1 Tax=Sphingomicrobium nitratireducens TaxID=2964666 RepID=UPI002240A133|nr:type II secretion system F family protein [Sphingomicrobium nitratireducens]